MTVAVLERHSGAAGSAHRERGPCSTAADRRGGRPGGAGDARRRGSRPQHPPAVRLARACRGAQVEARTIVHLHNFQAPSARSASPIGTARRASAAAGRTRCRDCGCAAAARSWARRSVYAVGLRRQQPHVFTHSDHFHAVSRAGDATAADRARPAAGRSKTSDAAANFVRETRVRDASHVRARATHALVSGRLVEEKGFDTAIAAAGSRPGVPLVIAGEGPDERRLRGLAEGGDVRFAGLAVARRRWRSCAPGGDRAGRRRGGRSRARSRSARRARGRRVPVLASDRGGLPELRRLRERCFRSPTSGEWRGAAWARRLFGAPERPASSCSARAPPRSRAPARGSARTRYCTSG